MPSHINRTPLRQRSNSDLKSNSYSVQLVSPEFDAGIDAARKVDEILLLLSDPEVDLWKLREFALSPGGLINDNVRKQAWPKLVGLNGVTNDLTTFKEIKDLSTPLKKTQNKYSNHDAKLLAPVDVVDPSSTSGTYQNRIMARSLDANQIELDINRCTWHLLSGTQRYRQRTMRNKHRKKIFNLLRRKQRRLGNLINLVLIQSYSMVENLEEERLRYFQGYHDVACIFLNALGGGNTGIMPILSHENPAGNDNDETSVNSADSRHFLSATKTATAMGLDLPSRVLLQISFSHFSDAMKSNFKELSAALRLIIMPLLGVFDAEVHSHLYKCQMEPFFAISWIITWFSHDIRDTELVKRLYDVFLVSHPMMPIYMSIAMVLHPFNRNEILSTECDFAYVHQALADLPKNSCNVGWKFLGHDSGFVSGDEDDDCNSVDQSILSMDDSNFDERDDDESSLAPSLASSSMLSGNNTKVHFEELIDLAIMYMRRIPPRKLIPLAKKYFTDAKAKQLLGQCSTVALLQPPPTWGLINSVPSDFVLKQRVRESRGLSKTSRRLRRTRSRSRNRSLTRRGKERKDMNKHDGATNGERGHKNNGSKDDEATLAKIAIGIGPDGDGDAAKEKRRRKMLRNIAIGVGVVAITIGLFQSGAISVPLLLSKFNSSDSSCDTKESSFKGSDGVCTVSTSAQENVKTVSSNNNELLSQNSQSGKVSRNGGNKKLNPIQMLQAIANSAKIGLERDAEVIGI